MAYANGVISAPINASDPYKVMGVAKKNGTWDVGYICGNAHGKIDKWARYKPFRDSKPTTNSLALPIMNYGLSLPTERSNATDTKQDRYAYLPPRGASYTEYYRLTDFENYDHNARAPYECRGDVELNIMFNSSTKIWYTPNKVMTTLGLTTSDFAFLKNYYLALVLTDEDGNEMWKTTDDVVANSAIGYMEVDKSELPTTTDGTKYSYYVVATSVKKTSFSAVNLSGTWVQLPCDHPDNMQGTLTVTRDFPLRFTCTGIANWLKIEADSGIMFNADNYVGVMPENGGAFYYFSCMSPYGLQLAFTIENPTDKDVSIPVSYFSVNLSRTFNSTTGVSNRALQGVWQYADYTWTQLTEITVPANGSLEYVGFDLPLGVMSMNANGLTGAVTGNYQMQTTVSFNVNGVSSVRSQIVRVKNSVDSGGIVGGGN